MNVAVFSSKPYDKRTLLKHDNNPNIQLTFFESRLSEETVSLVSQFDAVSCFVNDQLNHKVIKALKAAGVNAIALRCAGYNNVDLNAAKEIGIKVYHVPDYSPTSVAEHAVALILTLNRKTHKAYQRVKEGNFALEGLMGFNLAGKTVGCIGTGRIGLAFAKIMLGFGCNVLCYDPEPDPELHSLGVSYVALEELYCQSDIISLHCPLTKATHHLIDTASLQKMKDGVMLINTSRGALVNAQSAVKALYDGKIGALGLDVYEDEGSLFFEDMSEQIILDSVFQLLLTFPNVIVTGHQGYFTDIALDHIAETTLENLETHRLNQPSERQLF
ncbi:2-hydroxyacid dehydrogenase [Marinomonas agarivorans]|nr:2-hydroxyacid dehydrogenase [Marinomonas agarivorans]